MSKKFLTDKIRKVVFDGLPTQWPSIKIDLSLPEPGLFIGGVKLNDHLSHLLDTFCLRVSNLEEAGGEVVVDGDVQLDAPLLYLRVNVLLVVWVNGGNLEEGRGSVEIVVNALQQDESYCQFNSD